MKRLLACIAVLALVSACGSAEDDVAATVNGRDVRTSEVTKFAATPFIKEQAQRTGAPLVSNQSGSVGGNSLRLALPFHIQTLIFEDAVRARKGRITSEDTDAAEQALAANETDPQTGQQRPIDAAARKVLARYVAAQAALTRLLTSKDSAADPASPAKVAAFFEENRAGYENLSCVEGFAVAESAAAQAQAALDAGATTVQIVATGELQAQGLSQSGEPECVFPAAVTNDTIAPIVFGGELGVWARTDIDDGNGGIVTVFLRPISRSTATAQTPEVAGAIGQQLQQGAEQADQAAVGEQFGAVFAAADVEVDPRIGNWNPRDQAQLILPPPVPTAKPLDLPPIAGLAPG